MKFLGLSGLAKSGWMDYFHDEYLKHWANNYEAIPMKDERGMKMRTSELRDHIVLPYYFSQGTENESLKDLSFNHTCKRGGEGGGEA